MRGAVALLCCICAAMVLSTCSGEEYYGGDLTKSVVAANQSDSSSNSSDVAVTEVSTTSADADSCAKLTPNPPRGLSCLQCMHPSALAQADAIVDILVRSCLQNVAINYLADGYFGFSEETLKSHLERLTSGGRRLVVEFYLSNGPNQRRRKPLVDSFGAGLTPPVLRKRIISDPELQADFQAIVYRLLPVIRFAAERNAEVLLVPALEDNFDDESFEQAYLLAREVIPSELHVHFGRNPCPSCYPGNESGRPEGVFLERHVSSPDFSLTRGVVTNDGFEYFETGEEDGDKLTLEDLKAVQDRAAENNDVFILWSRRRQGQDGSEGRQKLSPDARTYPVPGKQEQEELILFLRSGIS